jgi:hypothetical protein
MDGNPLILRIAPGFFSEATDREAVGRWKTGDRVRFKNKLPQKMGGWEEATITGATLRGTDRREHEWTSLDGQAWIAQGTSKKLYIIGRGVRYDITPVRRSVTLSDPFSTTNGSATVTVMDALAGVEQGDFVRFSGASAVGGITIDGEYEVVTVLNGNQYQIIHSSAATSDATGGGSVAAEYDINSGGADAAQAHGWGTCLYNRGTWGTRRGDCSSIVIPPRIWSLDNFGEDLLASPRGGGLYWWDRSQGPGTRAVLVETAPQTMERMLVSPSGDQVIALGAFDDISSTSDKMLVRTSAAGSFADWATPIDPDEDTTVFEERLGDGSRLITGTKTSGGIVIHSDTMSYIMRPDPIEGWDIDPLGAKNTPVGPNAAVDVNGTEYSMAKDKFMTFDGVKQELPCDVWGWVFDNEAAAEGLSPGINVDQIEKVYAYYNDKGDEVTWLYPSLNSIENDRYVCFNKGERVWYYGTLSRTAMSTGGIAYSLPYGSAPTGELFLHEGVPDADGALMNEYIESWDMQIEDGGRATHLSLFIPDFKRWVGTMRMQVKVKDSPQQTTYVTSTYDMEDTITEQGVYDCGRQMAVRFGSIDLGSNWRMGFGTFYGQPDGAR